MGEEHLNTARLNEVTQIDSLDEAQRAAVAALRKKAGARGVTPYTLGVLDTRDMEKLSRLSDGKRLTLLTPATREVLIQEVRECVYPWNPAVVAVWSFWAEKNGVEIESEPRVTQEPLEPGSLAHLSGQAPERPPLSLVEKAEARKEEAVETGTVKQVRVYGRVEKAVEILTAALADGEEHESHTITDDHPEINKPAWDRARHRIDVKVRLAYNYRGKQGRTAFWSLSAQEPLLAPLRAKPGTAEAELRKLLADGELPLKQIMEVMPFGRSVIFEVAAEIGVVRRYEPSSKGKIVLWSLPSGAVTLNDTPGEDEVPYRVYTPRWMRDEIDADYAAVCEELGVKPRTLAWWVEGRTGKSGLVSGTSILGDRESDAAIQLADRIFRMCFPSMPTAVNERLRLRNQHAEL